ncbi:MAG: hypothetical protein HAW62_02905 [Endozoicomonadaceae bacterium]|nr:hypothetical protein [Endozoicomonadaceae bacterium]
MNKMVSFFSASLIMYVMSSLLMIGLVQANTFTAVKIFRAQPWLNNNMLKILNADFFANIDTMIESEKQASILTFFTNVRNGNEIIFNRYQRLIQNDEALPATANPFITRYSLMSFDILQERSPSSDRLAIYSLPLSTEMPAVDEESVDEESVDLSTSSEETNASQLFSIYKEVRVLYHSGPLELRAWDIIGFQTPRMNFF